MLSTLRSASRSSWRHTATAHFYAPTSIPTARLIRTSCVGCDPRGPRLASSPRWLMLHHRSPPSDPNHRSKTKHEGRSLTQSVSRRIARRRSPRRGQFSCDSDPARRYQLTNGIEQVGLSEFTAVLIGCFSGGEHAISQGPNASEHRGGDGAGPIVAVALEDGSAVGLLDHATVDTRADYMCRRVWHWG
jgi:hypothetical protein